MTDKYGNTPNNRENHESEHEHDLSVSPEADAWQGDQPPIDDFADQTGEEMASVSEETEMHDDINVANAAAKKPSLLLPIAASVGGLLFLGAILYWQFGTNHTGRLLESASLTALIPAALNPLASAPAPTVPTTAFAATGGNNVKPPEPANTGVAPTTAMGSFVSPSKSETMAQNPIAQTGSAIPNGVPPIPNGVPPQASTFEPAPAAPVSPAPQTLAQAAPAPIPAPTLSPTPSSSVAPLPSSESVSADPAMLQSTDVRLTTLAAHVVDLQKSLAQVTQQLSQVSTMLAAQPQSPSVANAATEERLLKVEQELAQLHHSNAPSLAAPSVAPTAVPASLPVALATVPEPSRIAQSATTAKAKHKNDAAKHKTARKRKITARRSTVIHSPKAAAPGVKPGMAWQSKPELVIRAAMPGEAWVAKDATTRELRPVHIGDQLPGVGRVQAIHQNGDIWVIEGTEATLH
jgi:hypothetical protein